MTTMFLCFIATVNGNTNPQFLIWFSHLGVSEGQYVMDSGWDLWYWEITDLSDVYKKVVSPIGMRWSITSVLNEQLRKHAATGQRR